MDKCSYFVRERALFGCFPTQEAVDELENEGVRYFVNLTYDDESLIVPYTTQYTRIDYPIPDRSIPTDWGTFAQLILRLSDITFNLPPGQRLYLHCKGGHGRSGVVVACLLIQMFNLMPETALEKTSKCHSRRKVMRPKWRKLGSPQTRSQKLFVERFFEPLCFYRASRSGPTAGFSNFSPHTVEISGFGLFPTSEAARQAYRAPEDAEYVRRLEVSRTPHSAKLMGSKILPSAEWYRNRERNLRVIVENKFRQHPELLANLMRTGLRPIVERKGSTEFDRNMLGRVLTEVRNAFYREM